MKRFNFGTFLVDDSNRRAFQLCQDIAELKPVSPLPAVLLGDEGCGKTHLLYSIVNRIRAGTTKTGLAYVTAADFPDQVRQLIDDPSPVERAQSAVLLVDQLDRFTDLIDELEAVVRIFLDHHHYVVLATKVHPGRLQNLSPGFRAIIESGQVIQIVPRGAESQIETIKRQLREESDTQLANKQQEIEQLRSLLNRVGKENNPEAPANVAALRAELEAERIAKADMGRKLAEAREAAENAREEASRVLGVASTDADDLEATRNASRVTELERLADALREEANQARMEASENLDTARELHEQLEQIRADAARHVIAADEAREQVERVETETTEAFARAGAADAELEVVRAAIAAEQQTVHDLKSRMEQLESESAAERARFDELREELEQTHATSSQRGSQLAELQGLFDQTSGEASGAREQYAAVQEELQETSAQLAQAEGSSRQLREHLQQVQAEAESLRAQADAQRAEVDELHAQLAAAREESQRAGAEAESMRAVMSDTDRLQQEFADVKSALDEARGDAQRHQRERDELEAQGTTLTAQLDETRAESNAVVNRMQTVLAQIESVRERAHDQREAQRAQIEELEALLETQARAAVQPDVLAAVKAQADDAVAQIDALRHDFDRERAEMASAHTATQAGYDAQIQSLRHELDSTRAEAEQVDSERETLHVELERIKHDVESTRAHIGELIQARESAAATYLETERDREQLRASSAQEREQRMKFQSEAAKLRAERDAARAKLDSVEQSLNERIAELDTMKRNAAAAQSLAGELESRIARLETERESLKQTARNLQSQMENVANNLMQSGQAFFAALGGNPASNPGANGNDDSQPDTRSTSPFGNTPARLADTPGESWGPGGVSVLRPLDDLEPFDEEGSGRDI
ncbi:MAG: DnaA/Hda family protein [Candidatus Hydrogenedentes bacterium]|nr:DnaA/Hda family protein [Candidatus Hydrogenedentota bacterium]